jgi:hypothetical protein
MTPLLITLLLLASDPGEAVVTQPPPSFLEMELCGAAIGGTCSVRDFVELGLRRARWRRLDGAELWPGRSQPSWRLEAMGRLPGSEKEVALTFELYRTCEVRGIANAAPRPFAWVSDGWTAGGKDGHDDGPLWRLLERVSAERDRARGALRPPAPPSSPPTPPESLLGMEFCAPRFKGRSCTVRQAVAALPGKGAHWAHFEENARDRARRGPEGWRLIVPAPAGDPEGVETHYEFTPSCAWGWPVADLTMYEDGRILSPSPSWAVGAILARLVEGAKPSWPPVE